MLLFSNKKNADKLKGQILPRKLLSLIVHGLYPLPDNVDSIDCIQECVGPCLKELERKTHFVLNEVPNTWGNSTLWKEDGGMAMGKDAFKRADVHSLNFILFDVAKILTRSRYQRDGILIVT